jgi:L-threonylcarbamoyladenylate synthase
VTDRLPATPEGIAAATGILNAGGLVAFPTDTVYGVACAASRPERLEAMFELKGRPKEKRIPMLVTDLAGIPAGWTVDEGARALADRFWPGALTLILPSSGDGTSQAFRAPNHLVAQALLQAAGPLFATSANVSGQPETLDADDVLIAFATHGDGLVAVIDGGRVPGGEASTVVDLTVTPALLLRPGPISRDGLAAVVDLVD